MPGPWDDYAPPAKPAGPWDDYATPSASADKPFTEKLGNFFRNVYENPPPSVAGARDVIKGLPAAAQELIWGADPQAAEQAAGTVAQAAQMGLGFRGLGGEGVFARPISAEGRAAPLIPPRVPLPPSAGETAVEAASRLPGNVQVPRYLATEGTTAPRVASGLSQVPFSGQPVVRSANELLTDLGRAKGEIAGGAATAETAGERARSSLEGFTATRSQKPVSEAYGAVDALINPDARVPLTNTAALVAEMNARRANANIPGTSKAVDIVSRAVRSPLDDIPPELQAGILKRNPELATPPGMDYAGIKDLRTYLRSKTPQQLITEGIDPTEAKRILGGLKLDLESVISQSGPEALAAWREANALASRTARERKALTRTIGLQGNASAEQVFNRLLTYAGSKSGADLGRLRLAKKAMGPEAWSDVGSAMINRMGMAPEGGFSADRFVTAFGNMSGAAKNELFSGQQAAALSDLFIVSKHVQDRITRLSNPSGTARNTIPFAIAAHLWTDPITAVANLVGQRMLAEVLSRPAAVRAATAVSRASMSGNPYARERALAALRAVVQAEGLLPKQQDEQLPRMQYGGRPTGPTVVGEDGPEVFVPDRPGTVIPANGPMPSRDEIQRYLAATTQNYPKFGAGGIPINPAGVDAMLERAPESQNIEDRRDERGGFDAAAARTRRSVRPPGGRQEGAGTQFVEGGYGIPTAYRALDRSAQDAFESAGSLQRGGSYDPAPVVAQALGAVGAPLVGPAQAGAVLGSGAIKPIRAYHGSPHDFERFDLSKIGTGEGAQAYGHGLYFAENPTVAKQYRDTLAPSRGKLPDDIISLPPEMRQAIMAHAGTDADAVTAAKRAQYMSSALREVDLPKVTDMVERARLAKQGRMYEVNINAAPEQFLDWDKPLAQMSPEVQDKLHKAWLAHRDDHARMTGEGIYGTLEAQGWDASKYRGAGKPVATGQLAEAGIPGIKYLDQGSRGAKEGTSNYVLFRDDIIDIVKKYGLAGAAAMVGISKDEARAAMGRGRPQEATP